MVLSKDNRGIVRKNDFQICVLECVHIDKHTLIDKFVPCTHTLLLLLLLLLLAFLVICVKLLFYLYYKHHTYLLMSIILYLTLNLVKKTPGFLISITISHITLFYYNQYQRSYDYFPLLFSSKFLCFLSFLSVFFRVNTVYCICCMQFVDCVAIVSDIIIKLYFIFSQGLHIKTSLLILPSPATTYKFIWQF